MKFNKWTVALAAVGAVSLTSVAQAEEKLMLGSQAQLTSTTISGFVDTSVEWNDNDYIPGIIPYRGATKQDGFNLNVVGLTLEKALDESEWSSGYKAELWLGPDSAGIGTQMAGGDLAIKQAYVALRTPVGNGIDWKVGVFDTIVGYEASNAGANPNFTRSWGYAMEPTQHTGFLAAYRLCDLVSFTAGVANTENALINDREQNAWDVTYLASVAVTAPEDWGFIAGSTLYAGVVIGSDNDNDNYYIGATFNTPISDLRVGVAYDYRSTTATPTPAAFGTGDAWVVGTYASFQATEKLSLHGRLEYGEIEEQPIVPAVGSVFGATLTAQYDLWQNVISRLEVRWDEVSDVGHNGLGSSGRNTTGVYANLIYNF